VDWVRLGPGRSAGGAGRSAEERFETLARAWRRRALRPVFLFCSGLVIAFTVAGNLIPGQTRFWFGLLAGATMAVYLALRDSPPGHIEKWRAGSEGERLTAKALRPLARDGWRVWHDRDGGKATNIDHIVLGGAGVFLLDSKNYSGEANIENGELKVHWLEDPEDGWVCRGIVARMRGASAELKERIEAATGVRVWVQPIVVLWTRFPQRTAQSSDVFFVHGSSLTEWLRDRRPSARGVDEDAISRFLGTLPPAGHGDRAVHEDPGPSPRERSLQRPRYQSGAWPPGADDPRAITASSARVNSIARPSETSVRPP
jgi:Nuclease-related domain